MHSFYTTLFCPFSSDFSHVDENHFTWSLFLQMALSCFFVVDCTLLSSVGNSFSSFARNLKNGSYVRVFFLLIAHFSKHRDDTIQSHCAYLYRQYLQTSFCLSSVFIITLPLPSPPLWRNLLSFTRRLLQSHPYELCSCMVIFDYQKVGISGVSSLAFTHRVQNSEEKKKI